MSSDGKRQRTADRFDLSAQRAPTDAAAVLRELADAAEAAGTVFDVYGAGASLQAFEGKLAALLGKPAAAFFPTGTCAQQSALCALTTGAGPFDVIGKPTILLHPTSHLVYLDCLRDGADQARQFNERCEANLPEFDVRAVGEMSRPLGLADVKAAFDAFSLIGDSILVIELPQRMNGGGAAPFEELVSIAALCRERNVRLHLDGARLWEVAPHFGKSYAEICAVFDTAYVSFYKGVGALSGAMILGPADVINHTKVWQKRRGSNAFTFGPAALSCQHSLEGALNGSVASFEERYAWIGRMVATVSAIAAGVAMKGQLFFDPSVPQSAMVHCYLRGDAGLLEACHARAQERSGVRLWNQLRGRGHTTLPQMRTMVGGPAGDWHYFEWSAGPANALIPIEVAERGWRTFFEELGHAKSEE